VCVVLGCWDAGVLGDSRLIPALVQAPQISDLCTCICVKTPNNAPGAPQDPVQASSQFWLHDPSNWRRVKDSRESKQERRIKPGANLSLAPDVA